MSRYEPMAKCKNGHRFTDWNTLYKSNGWKQCKRCKIEAKKKGPKRNRYTQSTIRACEAVAYLWDRTFTKKSAHYRSLMLEAQAEYDIWWTNLCVEAQRRRRPKRVTQQKAA